MKSLESRVTPEARSGVTYAEREASPRPAEATYEEKPVAEKPEVSEEIAIEEINIDGMCGVY